MSLYKVDARKGENGMDAYFCPQCGESFEASDCREVNSTLQCPYCMNSRVILRGRILVALGLAIAFGAAMVPVSYLTTLGVLVGGGLCVTGLIRSLRQRRIRRKLRELDESDFPSEDELDDY